MMDEKKVREAIEVVENFPEWNTEDQWLDTEEMEELAKIIIEALEKQLPKQPTYDGDGYAPDGTFIFDEWLCPNCGSRYEVDYDDYSYCPNCGQRIDREEEEEL
ncbi:dNA polymerase II large subunit [Firmicutes bacterium CAG:646]|nr:dNA polymerase II large subunit [Firmicutes bacterium CAG:646]